MKAFIIGIGPHGKRILTILKDFPDIEVGAVVDVREEALLYEGIPATAKKYLSADSLWQEGGYDLGFITTNTPSHSSLAISAMEAGARYLLVEKPMASSLEESDDILTAAKKYGTRVAVGHLRRMAKLNIWLKEKISSGEWGELRSIMIQQPGIGLGCNATHAFDTIRFLTGKEPERVIAFVDSPKLRNPRGEQFVDPGGLVILDFGPNIRAVVNQIEDGAGPSTVEIDLTAARLRIDEDYNVIEIIWRDLTVIPGPGRPPRHVPLDIPDGISSTFDMLELLRGMLRNLISDEPIICDSTHGVKSLEILVASYLSQQRGNIPVALPIKDQEERKIWLPVT